jgi:hypothetical protein
MKSLILAVPALLAVMAQDLAAATVEATNPGHIQHAAALGVDPALFTEADLVALGRAMAENDATTVAWLKNRAIGRGVTTTPQSTNPGHLQHAASLGVDPALFSEADLVALDRAMDDNDAVTVAWLKNRAIGRGVTTTPQSTNPGHVQHAASLGVDPALFSEADLMALDRAMDDNDAVTVAWLKKKAEGNYFGAQ